MSDPKDDGEPRLDLDENLFPTRDSPELDAFDDDQQALSEEKDSRASATSTSDQTITETDYHDQRGVFSPDTSNKIGVNVPSQKQEKTNKSKVFECKK